MFKRLYYSPHTVLGRWQCTSPEIEWSAPETTAHCEMVVTLGGQWIRRRRGVEHVGNTNVTLFANAGDVYQVRHPQGERDDCGVVVFSEAAMDDLARAAARVGAGGDPCFASEVGSLPPGAFGAFRSLMDHAAASRSDAVEVEETIGRITALALAATRSISADVAADGARSRHVRAVRRAEEYLTAHFKAQVTLGEVARAVGYSPFHFARVFRAQVGLSVHRYLARLRLRAAISAVFDGERDLSGLAHGLGFSSHSHFTHAFRREYGRPPSQLRAPGCETAVWALARPRGGRPPHFVEAGPEVRREQPLRGEGDRSTRTTGP